MSCHSFIRFLFSVREIDTLRGYTLSQDSQWGRVSSLEEVSKIGSKLYFKELHICLFGLVKRKVLFVKRKANNGLQLRNRE